MDNKRIVKLIPRKPLYGIKRTPITSCVEKIELTTEEIRLCLVTKCLVDEYLPDGSLLRLDLSNYNQNNSIVQDEPADIVENTDETISEISQLVVHSDFSPVSPISDVKIDDDFTRSDETLNSGWGEENPANALLNLSVANPLQEEVQSEGDTTIQISENPIEAGKDNIKEQGMVLNSDVKDSTLNSKPSKNQSNKNNFNKKR